MIQKVLVQGFKIVISGFLVGFLLHRIGIQKVTEHFRSAEISWLIGALILFTSSHFLGSFQWYILLRSEKIRIPWTKTVSFYFVGLFFNNFLISGLGGDIFRMMDSRRYSKKGTGAVSTVFLDRFMGLLVLSGMAILASPWILVHKSISTHLQLPLIVLVSGWMFVLFFLFNKRFAQPFAWLAKRFIPKVISAKVREVYQKIHDFGRKQKLLLCIVVMSILIQGARIITHYLLSRSFGVVISPIYFFLVVPIIAVIASLPISLGGIGIREQTGIILFGIVGMTALQAFSVEFMAYLVAVISSLPGGIIFMGRRK